ncbi:MAG TPA: hypothetical protein VKY85_11510 [Candidatus Angelobacter sp.]|nr:hypothetical protein [Candidatus Angelobacter sp.]
MITHLGETSVLKEIINLDPELNGDAEYLRIRIHLRRVTIWNQARQFIYSPSVITVAVYIVLLILVAHLPS